MTGPIDHASEAFRRSFRPREFENVCVLSFAEAVDPNDSEALALLNAGVESMVRAGIAGFVFDLTRFSRHRDLEESLGQVLRFMHTVHRSRCPLNWLYGSRLVQEWKRLKLLGLPPENFETEREAVEGIQTVLMAARIRAGLAQRVVNSGLSLRHIANVAGLFESDVRKIAEGLQKPSDRIALLISSTLDSLSLEKSSSTKPKGTA